MSTSQSLPLPLEHLARWYDEAVTAGVRQPEAMALATATPDGRPSARYVLLRGLGPDGLRFFTNFESRKAEELDANPRAAALFYWEPLGRQVRVEGRIERLEDEISDVYFQSRPRGHRLAAWASPQSRPIAYDELLARYAGLERQYEGQEVPRPPFWGGYRLVPDRVELWQSRDNRLHERELHVLGPGGWTSERLGP